MALQGPIEASLQPGHGQTWHNGEHVSVKAGILLAFGDWHLDTVNGVQLNANR